jgi:hypothetical protein
LKNFGSTIDAKTLIKNSKPARAPKRHHSVLR